MKYVRPNRILPFLMILPLLIALIAPLAYTQEGRKSEEEITDPTMCSFCKTTGKLPNPYYESHQHHIDSVVYCSYCIEEDPQGYAIPWTPCWKCRNVQLKARAEKEFDKLVARRKKWIAERREIDKTVKVKKPLVHIETKHFKWSWNVPKFTHKKKTYRMHDGAHNYAERTEAFYDEFQKVHKITDLDNSNNTHNLFVFERQITGQKACAAYGGQASTMGKVTKQGLPSVYVTWWNKQRTPTEEDFHRDVIHNATHLVVSVYKTCWWLFESGFAYEGFSHWWEIYYYKKATCHCFQEISGLSNWVSKKWESKVKKAVLGDKAPSLAELVGKNGGALDSKEHMFSWSYVDYMMSMDTRKTLDFFDILKQRRPAREAFKEIWRTSIMGFEEKWKAWVIETYSIQEDDVPLIRRKR